MGVRFKTFVAIAVVGVLSALLLLPLDELISFAEFKIAPKFAKRSHFVRLKSSDQVIYLLGTTHGSQFDSSDYPYWQILSVIQALTPRLLLVEIRPEAIVQGLWGEGPPEMPLAFAWAKKMNIPVRGMDYWRPGENSAAEFSHREDQMVKNILAESRDSKVTLILTGFSHVAGLKQRLAQSGYQLDEKFENADKDAMFNNGVERTIPEIYFEAVTKVATLASQGKSDYPKDWAVQRFQLLANLKRKTNGH